MSLVNHGVGAEGLLAAQSVLGASSDQFGNDGRLEHLWAMKAMEHAEVYFNLLCSVEPSRLKLTGSKESDDLIYQDFREQFSSLQVGSLTEQDLKSEEAKTKWRTFAESYKNLEDYSLGALLRLDASKDYSEENSIIVIKVQFLALEIARNREGLNDDIRNKFKPTERRPRQKGPPAGAGVTRGGVAMSEIEHELHQILGGHHQLLS